MDSTDSPIIRWCEWTCFPLLSEAAYCLLVASFAGEVEHGHAAEIDLLRKDDTLQENSCNEPARWYNIPSDSVRAYAAAVLGSETCAAGLSWGKRSCLASVEAPFVQVSTLMAFLQCSGLHVLHAMDFNFSPKSSHPLHSSSTLS